MYYQVITSEPFNVSLFSNLSDAKQHVIALHQRVPSVIRHRINDRTIRITTYLPCFGFKTETVEEIYKSICNKQDCKPRL